MSASIDGFYAVYLSGKLGQGFAMLVFRGGRIVGADASGFMFDGQYSEPVDNILSVRLSVKAPPNQSLIQGGTTGPQGEQSQLIFEMPRDFSSREFVRIETQRGPVNAKLVRLRGLDE
jgi:hypothetical protein